MQNKAVFLDRDGTINIDPGFLSDPNNITFFEGVIEGLQLLQKNSFSLYIISNQSGVGRGYFSLEQLDLVNNSLLNKLKKFNIIINGIACCVHTPDDNCACRKPKPGMILRAMDELGIDPKSSYMVGDSARDICAGREAGLFSILIAENEKTDDTSNCIGKPDAVVHSLLEAAQYILSMA